MKFLYKSDVHFRPPMFPIVVRDISTDARLESKGKRIPFWKDKDVRLEFDRNIPQIVILEYRSLRCKVINNYYYYPLLKQFDFNI